MQTRLAAALAEVSELTTFKNLALSRLAAQHDEITLRDLRRTLSAADANDVRNRVYSALRAGARQEWAHDAVHSDHDASTSPAKASPASAEGTAASRAPRLRIVALGGAARPVSAGVR